MVSQEQEGGEGDGTRRSRGESQKRTIRLDLVKDDEALTLDNFDETDAMADPILTSPRSLEACRMLGIEPLELIQRPLEYFIRSRKRGQEEDRDLITKRASRFETKRQLQLQHVRAQRHELMEAQVDGVHGQMSARTRSLCRSPVGAARLGFTPAVVDTCQQEFTVLEREKKELERIQHRQALELQQLLNFELKMAALEQERVQKEQMQKQRDEALANERKRRQREAEEHKRNKELEKAKQHRFELEMARRQAEEKQKENLRREERAKLEAAIRLRDAQLSEREHRRRQEELRVQNERYQLAQEREATRKMRELQEREERLMQEREHQKHTKALELQEKQARNTARVAHVLLAKDCQRKAQLEEAARKQQQSEERRRAFEEERRQKDEDVRLKALRKKEMIENVQTQLTMMEDERRARLRDQERVAHLRRVQREREKQQQLEAHQREERRLEYERRRANERMEAQLRLKQSAILRKREEKALVAQEIQSQKHASIRARLQDAKLREEEIQTALERKKKQDAYRTTVLLSRIEYDNQRTLHLKEQRAYLLSRRQQIKQQASREKHELLESFYKMKVTKKLALPQHLVTKMGEHLKAASTSALLPVDTEASSKAGETSRRKRLTSATMQRSRSAPGMARRHRVSSSRRPLDSDGPYSDDEVMRGADCEDEESKRAAVINHLRKLHNEQLLKVLEEEQYAEEQREYLLQQVRGNRSEYERLEEIFDKERALASERIIELTDRLDRDLTAKMDELYGR